MPQSLSKCKHIYRHHECKGSCRKSSSRDRCGFEEGRGDGGQFVIYAILLNTRNATVVEVSVLSLSLHATNLIKDGGLVPYSLPGVWIHAACKGRLTTEEFHVKVCFQFSDSVLTSRLMIRFIWGTAPTLYTISWILYMCRNRHYTPFPGFCTCVATFLKVF